MNNYHVNIEQNILFLRLIPLFLNLLLCSFLYALFEICSFFELLPYIKIWKRWIYFNFRKYRKLKFSEISQKICTSFKISHIFYAMTYEKHVFFNIIFILNPYVKLKKPENENFRKNFYFLKISEKNFIFWKFQKNILFSENFRKNLLPKNSDSKQIFLFSMLQKYFYNTGQRMLFYVTSHIIVKFWMLLVYPRGA